MDPFYLLYLPSYSHACIIHCRNQHGIFGKNQQQRVLPTTCTACETGPRDQYDDDEDNAAGGGDEAAGLQKALSVVDLESRLDVGGEVVETVLSVLEGEPYR